MRWRFVGGLCAAALALGGCGREHGGGLRLPDGTPVVIISVDTLRSDRLPVYGYGGVETPAIDGLRRDGVLFERAYTQVPLTLPAHVSLLTGLLPPDHGARDNLGYTVDAARTPMLQQRLRERGYATGAAVSAFVLRRGTGIGDGFDFFDDDLEITGGVGLQGIQRPGFETLERVRPWLGTAAGGPFFLFFHVFEPHSPYQPPEPFASRYPSPYDGEVAAADAVVGGLLDELRRLGAYDRALVVFMSDHGEGLGEHGEDEHGLFLYRSTLQVPLIVKLPLAAQAGASVARPVQLIDLAPTVLSALDPAVDQRLPGRPLFDPEATEGDSEPIFAETMFPRLHFGWSDLASVIVGRDHYIAAPRPELYDLEDDPGETADLASVEPDRSAELAAILERWEREMKAPAATDAATRRRLEALGYVGSAAAVDGRDLPDPKDRVGALHDLREAARLLADGAYDDAAAAFAAVVASEPGIEDAWDYLGRALELAGRPNRALEASLDGLREIPDSGRLALSAATRLYRAGRLDQAAELAARGVGYDPAAAHALSAEIALAAGNLELAETEAREAAAAGGGRPGPSLVLADVLLARGQPVMAVEVLQRALADGLDDESVRVKLARILLGGGELAAAEQALAGLEASTQPETLLVLGRLAAVQQRWDEAVRFFDRALVSDPGNPVVTINLGILALGRGRAAEARPLLERGVRGAPGSFEGWNALGVARAQTGDADGAIAAWGRALELQPQAVDLLFNLGLAHAQAGHPDRAADYLDSFAERAPDGAVRERAREMARQLRRSGG